MGDPVLSQVNLYRFCLVPASRVPAVILFNFFTYRLRWKPTVSAFMTRSQLGSVFYIVGVLHMYMGFRGSCVMALFCHDVFLGCPRLPLPGGSEPQKDQVCSTRGHAGHPAGCGWHSAVAAAHRGLEGARHGLDGSQCAC